MFSNFTSPAAARIAAARRDLAGIILMCGLPVAFIAALPLFG